MSHVEARLVRVYLSESNRELEHLLTCLHDELGVRGVTVARRNKGYGSRGARHTAFLVEPAPEPRLVLEFLDEPAEAARAIERISDLVDPGHVVSWAVTTEGEQVC
jgi:PII-like signaling protein